MDKRLLSMDDLGEELCKYCNRTDYGRTPVNTGPWNLCEGGDACEVAYNSYIMDACDDEDEED